MPIFDVSKINKLTRFLPNWAFTKFEGNKHWNKKLFDATATLNSNKRIMNATNVLGFATKQFLLEYSQLVTSRLDVGR